ncbi:MAG: hypothetical protein NT028_12110 [candidate division Zixibacteria bacterium]|nr:hypothetical protein [candidate division Zixibacteria bacterium]
MKKTKILLSLVMFLLMTTLAWGVSSMTGKWQGSRTVLIYDTIHTINANSLEMFVYNNGNFAYDNANLYGKTDGLYYPRGTKKTVIYDAGLWIGAKVNNQVRIAMAEYSSEFAPGPMKNGTYQADQAAFKIYKIKRGDDATSNPDYRDWPVDQGAPVDAEGKPAILGDQFLWSACNDANPTKHTNNSASTAPLGVEVQQSTFAYARGGALGTTIFMKFKFINKGANQLDSTYVSLWADPDLGDPGDDLVGCDTALSLGYCYNSGADATYGAAPPAVGFDFFQGPIVPGEPTDSAYSFGVWNEGKKKLGMTAFSKYINGEDPQAASEVYLFMKGYRKLSGQMVPAVDPNGDTTTFVFAGDPQTQTGWLDILPNDRRFMMTSGPFTMAPGDSQEVVVAVLVGQGSNALSSIGSLKQVDSKAQAVFDLNFNIPNPPPSPTVFARGLNGEIDLTWGNEPVGSIEKNDALNQEFHFEGFNLYQGETAQGPWTRFTVYDEVNQAVCAADTLTGDTTYCDLALIYDDIVDPIAGDAQRVIVQQGSNAGLTNHLILKNSRLDGSTIKDNQPYFFGVTAYSVDYRGLKPFSDKDGRFLGFLTENLESPIVSYEARSHTQVGYVSDTAAHEGNSDGLTVVEYYDYSKMTGHDYEVSFNEDLSWKLKDLTTGAVKLDSQYNQLDNFDYQVVDGVMPRVTGLPPGIKGWEWVGGTRWLTGEDLFGGNLDFLSGGLWNGFDFWGSAIDPTTDYVDVEIRFSKTTTQKAHQFLRGGSPNYGYGGYFECPFTVWDVTADPPRQLNALFVEQNGQPTHDSTWFPGASGTAAREYLFVMNSTYSETPNAEYSSGNLLNDGEFWDILYALVPKIRVGHDPAVEFEDGQKLIIYKANPNITSDKFTFTVKKPEDAAGQVVAKTLDDIKTVPNPYYNLYQEETDQFDRIVKFINLPPVPMKIRIFNIAGDLVRTMDRTDVYNSEFVWNLKTDQGLWVASGVYVWLIEAEGLGSKYGKMAIFTEVEQLNNF